MAKRTRCCGRGFVKKGKDAGRCPKAILPHRLKKEPRQPMRAGATAITGRLYPEEPTKQKTKGSYPRQRAAGYAGSAQPRKHLGHAPPKWEKPNLTLIIPHFSTRTSLFPHRKRRFRAVDSLQPLCYIYSGKSTFMTGNVHSAPSPQEKAFLRLIRLPVLCHEGEHHPDERHSFWPSVGLERAGCEQARQGYLRGGHDSNGRVSMA